jgi:hypothetical protein
MSLYAPYGSYVYLGSQLDQHLLYIGYSREPPYRASTKPQHVLILPSEHTWAGD